MKDVLPCIFFLLLCYSMMLPLMAAAAADFVHCSDQVANLHVDTLPLADDDDDNQATLHEVVLNLRRRQRFVVNDRVNKRLKIDYTKNRKQRVLKNRRVRRRYEELK